MKQLLKSPLRPAVAGPFWAPVEACHCHYNGHAAGTSTSPAANPRLHPPSQQPTPYFGAATPSPDQPPQLPPPVAAAPQPRRNSLLRRGFPSNWDSIPQSPFRNRAAAASNNAHGPPPSWPLRRLSAARLWNPTNSTPRTSAAATRRRRPSTPPPPAVPLQHPALDSNQPFGTGAGDYPLLTLQEQRQSRHSISTRASLPLETNERRISLPGSVRHSYDQKRVSITPSPVEEPEAGPSQPKPVFYPREEQPRLASASATRHRGQSVVIPSAVGLVLDRTARATRPDKGKGKETMTSAEMNEQEDHGDRGFSQDLERGPEVLNPRYSTASRLSGIGSAISSDDSSIMGDPDQAPADVGDEWGPQHPCYPHLNPHVPVDSPEYGSTRIIRVRRDWLVEGDLAPTFSNLYPEILDPAGLSEQEFRRVIEKLNGTLIPAFSPYNWRNVVDGVLGLATGWLWEDFGFTGVKARLKHLEQWIEEWNADMAKSVVREESAIPPKIIPLRETGYMTLDIQIPDPEIVGPSPSTPGASRSGAPAERQTP
ncbi:Golgin subfamily A member 7/ERF4 family-domain-containing protein [Coniochaeta sp. 2T2.1]|nr:Golgin subfamily A member 7/ERF4 family-domain-containing protein [Coniochaeta sp. 2T2.1]